MKILGSRVGRDGVYSYVEIDTEAGTMRLFGEQKLYRRFGLLFAGVEWEDRLPEVAIPANKAEGRGETLLRGFTGDREVAAVFERFLAWDGESEWHAEGHSGLLGRAVLDGGPAGLDPKRIAYAIERQLPRPPGPTPAKA